jgi:hypothetical protein
VWKTRGYNSDCDVYEYFERQYENQAEYLMMGTVGSVRFLAGLLWLLYRGRKFGNNFMGKCLMLFFAHYSYYELHGTAHFFNDLTHLNGNVMHHSELKKNGFNGALVGTCPHGQGLVILCVGLFMMYSWAQGVKRCGYDARDFMAINGVVNMLLVCFYMKYMHGKVHGMSPEEAEQDWTKGYYDVHIGCHHYDGRCIQEYSIVDLITELYAWIVNTYEIKAGDVRLELVNYSMDALVMVSAWIKFTFAPLVVCTIADYVWKKKMKSN